MLVFKQDRSILPLWSLHLFKRLPRKEVRKRMQNVEQLLKVKLFTGIGYVIIEKRDLVMVEFSSTFLFTYDAYHATNCQHLLCVYL